MVQRTLHYILTVSNTSSFSRSVFLFLGRSQKHVQRVTLPLPPLADGWPLLCLDTKCRVLALCICSVLSLLNEPNYTGRILALYWPGPFRHTLFPRTLENRGPTGETTLLFSASVLPTAHPCASFRCHWTQTLKQRRKLELRSPRHRSRQLSWSAVGVFFEETSCLLTSLVQYLSLGGGPAGWGFTYP